MFEDVPCKSDPRAPHGFMRDESHTLGRYVCECEYWEGKPLDRMDDKTLNTFTHSLKGIVDNISNDDIIFIIRSVEDYYEIK